jgi:hypothetical protein
LINRPSRSPRMNPGEKLFLILMNPRLVIFFAGLLTLSTTLAAQKDTLTIIGVGDIMMGTDYPSRLYLPPGDDCRPLLEDVIEVLQDADITFGNLEGTFAGDSGIAKECLDTTKCFVFRMPVHYVNCLVDAGFDLLSIANNHSNDFGTGGRRETERVLRENGLAFAGSLSTPSAVIDREGIRYGLLAFAPNQGCYSILDPQLGAAMVRQLRPECDVLIVSVHGGAEGADHQHMTREPEVYLGHDRGNIYEFAHTVIDAGADVVFGHGPHVTRAAEVYRDRFIIYSLGNFCTYRRFNLRGPNGIAPIVKLYLAPDGQFLGGEVIPVYQPGEGGPLIDPQKRAIAKLRELTRQDFPELQLVIGGDGGMTCESRRGPAADTIPVPDAIPVADTNFNVMPGAKMNVL